MLVDASASPPIDPGLSFRLDHLRRLTGDAGLFEHSWHDEPRREHGLTTDDNARALVVLRRAWTAGLLDGDGASDLSPYLEFVVGGLDAGGWHNRMNDSGRWTDRRGSDDCHGRALWGLGEVIAVAPHDESVVDALQAGLHGFRSSHPRAVAYAVLGAVAARRILADDPLVESFLERVSVLLPRPSTGRWAWPAERLTYDNARMPEAMIRAGVEIGDATLIDDGLTLLDWLVEQELGVNGFSFTPVGGRGRRDNRPAFDQQPLEAWAMADACATAFDLTGSERWIELARTAVAWFFGVNDGNRMMYDVGTGAGFDGLQEWGVNQNRGAESTLSALGSIVRSSLLDELALSGHGAD